MPNVPFQRWYRELKRRNVVRVAVVYALVAWVVIEVADTVFPNLLLPDWLVTAVTILAVLGFPIALVLAWAFELTPEGVKRAMGTESAAGTDRPAAGPAADSTAPASGRGTAAASAPSGPWRSWLWAAIALVTVLGAVAVYLATTPAAPYPVPSDRSIAVLPFDNMSGAAENEYFSDGITEDILTSLSRIEDLRVISRTSAMRYKGSDKAISEIAEELGVGYVLEGSVRRAGDRVRITAQLIHAPSDSHRWAENYDRRLTDIFAIQSEIARAIAGELRAELSPETRRRIEAQPTDDIVAYEDYLKGRGLLDQRTGTAMRGAIDHFERAIARDSAYALAWAGLADAVSLLEFYDYPVPASAPSALEAARRAVEVDPTLGVAHTALGIAYALRHNGPAAIEHLEEAIDRAPGYGEPYAWLAWVHLVTGDPEAAVARAEEAVELDPLAPAYHAYLAESYLAAGAASRALDEARRAIAIQPEYGLTHFMEALALHHLGRPGEAVSSLERARSLVPPVGTPTHTEIDAALALARLAAGDSAVARALLRRMEGGGVGSDAVFSVGLVRAAHGDLDGAFDAFGRVEEWGSFSNDHLRYFFPELLVRLRADPRYAELLRDADRDWGVAG